VQLYTGSNVGLVVNLPQMVAQANLDFDSVIIIRDYSNELMSYVDIYLSVVD